jgi:lactoylglutathione lyase
MVVDSLIKTYMCVRDMDRAVEFYARLGLDVAYQNPERTRTFLWVNAARRQQITLWLPSAARPFCLQHVAFGVELSRVRAAKEWLEGNGIELFADFGKAPIEPIVHNWIPAASFSFNDLDGNHLEFFAPIPGAPIPEDRLPPREQQPLYLSDWERLRRQLDQSGR